MAGNPPSQTSLPGSVDSHKEMNFRFSGDSCHGSLVLTACLLVAATPSIQGKSDNPPATQNLSATSSAPVETNTGAPVTKTPEPHLYVQFDPEAGAPARPSRPRQVPMIVIVIIWLSVVTFWYLRKTRDPESPGR